MRSETYAETRGRWARNFYTTSGILGTVSVERFLASENTLQRVLALGLGGVAYVSSIFGDANRDLSINPPRPELRRIP